MNSKTILFTSLSLIATLFVACSEEKTTENTSDSKPQYNVTFNSENPNGTSELAQLMKDSYSDLKAMRSSVESGNMDFPLDLIQRIEAYPTAQATEEDMKPAAFDAFAKSLLERTSELKAAEPSNATEAYNGIVQSCLNCHSQACPGPMPKIDKLFL